VTSRWRLLSVVSLIALFVHFVFIMPGPSGTSFLYNPAGPDTDTSNLREQLSVCDERLSKFEKPRRAKFDRVVVTAANENPFYSFFAPFMAWGWKHRLGVQPIVFFSRSIHPLTVNATRWAGAIPIIVDNLWPNTGKQMQNIRTIVASYPDLFDDDTLITTADVDTIPLNSTYFSLPPLRIARNQLVVHGNHKQTMPTMYPLPYLTMTAKVWRDVMEINGLNLNEALAKMWNEHSAEIADIYFDQLYVFNQVQKYRKTHSEFDVFLNDWEHAWRLDFRISRDSNFDPKAWLVDAPGLRPGFVERNWARWVDGILRHIMDPEALAYFSKFREDFVRLVMKGDDVAKGLKDGFNREE
jgi:hypothetical protein